MKNFINTIYKKQGLIYKIFLYVFATALIVYVFPKGSKFKYDITQGKPWQYETLYAPFDFAILKSEEEIAKEKQEIRRNHIPYYVFNTDVPQLVNKKLIENISEIFTEEEIAENGVELVKFSTQLLNDIYSRGVLAEVKPLDENRIVYLKKGNQAEEAVYKSVLKEKEIKDYVNLAIDNSNLQQYRNALLELFFNTVKPNVKADEALTQQDLETKLNTISYTRGSVVQGSKIISRGEIIEGNKLSILASLKKEYESKIWTETNYYIVVIGYTMLVALALLMLMLFIYKYRPFIFENNTKVTFIFFNIVMLVLLSITAIKWLGNSYIYIVPLCILPLTLKAFFDTRLGMFAHVLTVLILGFIVPNSFEYMFLQIIAGIVTILTTSELYKRANLFISVGQITGVYIFAYFAFTIIQEGAIASIDYKPFLMFLLGGVATLFVQPLIYAYEKVFGLISDMSLLELSDTNSKLLKELSNKAPGTFHHSLNVANLAEASANEVGANAMLVRVGALYHDIGKMANPSFFTENQTSSVNPHDDLSPIESAQIIVNHVVYGIEIAKKHNLPDRIIDFIRTHHGTSLIYYFYKKAQDLAKEQNETIDIEKFRYPGPTPFSKETAILMMSDSVEAASKSLKEPSATSIEKLVDKIINKQMEAGQFLNADITFKEIKEIKKILKQKLKNIYHLRIEYPE